MVIHSCRLKTMAPNFKEQAHKMVTAHKEGKFKRPLLAKGRISDFNRVGGTPLWCMILRSWTGLPTRDTKLTGPGASTKPKLEEIQVSQPREFRRRCHLNISQALWCLLKASTTILRPSSATGQDSTQSQSRLKCLDSKKLTTCLSFQTENQFYQRWRTSSRTLKRPSCLSWRKKMPSNHLRTSSRGRTPHNFNMSLC